MKYLLGLWGKLKSSTLLMNSLYLMLATIVVSVFGFVFWIIITRNYDTVTVGLTATLLAVSGLLSMLSLSGFDTTLVRFLPKSKRRNDYMNSSILLVALVGVVITFGFAVSLPFASPKLAFVWHDPWYLAAFMFFTVVTALNTLTTSIFLAYKCAWDIFIINLIFSLLKIALPLLVPEGTVMTIFIMVGVSQLVGLILSLLIMRAQFGFRFSPHIHTDILRDSKKYSLSVYVSSLLNLLPPTLLPLIVVHKLGAASAAYYYMAFTMATVLYTIAYATMQSVFAEGSHDETAIKAHLAKAARLIGSMLIPAILITVILSSFILKVFGGQYAEQGSTLLRLFAISAIAVAIYSAMGTIFKIVKNLRGVIVMNVVYAVVILGVSYATISSFGVNAIGWAWIAGNLAAAATGLVFLKGSIK